MKKIAVVSVINDLATDQRVQRTASVLSEQGFHVVLFGRKLRNSPPVHQLPCETRRIRMIFTKGPLFYFFFNIRLFFFLLSKKADLLFANDLDTLYPNYLVSRIKKLALIYDSHEIFCEVPELKHTPLKKRIWERLEKKIVPHLKHCITVNQSIAGFFYQKYGVCFQVVRNIPESVTGFTPKSRKELKIPEDKTILILQGAGINVQRGAEELIEAMKSVQHAHLFIIGGGDVFDKLRYQVFENKLESKITILSKMPKSELLHYTYNADIGISIDKDTNLNYHFSLPNKIFDYLQAHLAILASRLPEIENLIKHYDTGCFIHHHEPGHIAERINFMIESGQISKWKENTHKAISENNWDSEKEKLKSIINSIH